MTQKEFGNKIRHAIEKYYREHAHAWDATFYFGEDEYAAFMCMPEEMGLTVVDSGRPTEDRLFGFPVLRVNTKEHCVLG